MLKAKVKEGIDEGGRGMRDRLSYGMLPFGNWHKEDYITPHAQSPPRVNKFATELDLLFYPGNGPGSSPLFFLLSRLVFFLPGRGGNTRGCYHQDDLSEFRWDCR
jgi:hypothetical protein